MKREARQAKLQRFGFEERAQLQRALDALARPGVTVRFGDPGKTPNGADAAGGAKWGGLLQDANGQFVFHDGLAIVNVEIILERAGGLDLAVVLAHEGAHAAQMLEYGQVIGRQEDPTGGPTDLTRYERERQAYNVSAIAADVFQANPRNTAPEYKTRGGHRILRGGRVRAGAIDDVIREFYSMPGLRMSQGDL